MYDCDGHTAVCFKISDIGLQKKHIQNKMISGTSHINVSIIENV